MRLAFDRRRWATAFPVGMYAVMCLSLAPLERSGLIRDLARVWVWIALAVWMLSAVGVLRRL